MSTFKQRLEAFKILKSTLNTEGFVSSFVSGFIDEMLRNAKDPEEVEFWQVAKQKLSLSPIKPESSAPEEIEKIVKESLKVKEDKPTVTRNGNVVKETNFVTGDLTNSTLSIATNRDAHMEALKRFYAIVEHVYLANNGDSSCSTSQDFELMHIMNFFVAMMKHLSKWNDYDQIYWNEKHTDVDWSAFCKSLDVSLTQLFERFVNCIEVAIANSTMEFSGVKPLKFKDLTGFNWDDIPKLSIVKPDRQIKAEKVAKESLEATKNVSVNWNDILPKENLTMSEQVKQFESLPTPEEWMGADKEIEFTPPTISMSALKSTLQILNDKINAIYGSPLARLEVVLDMRIPNVDYSPFTLRVIDVTGAKEIYSAALCRDDLANSEALVDGFESILKTKRFEDEISKWQSNNAIIKQLVINEVTLKLVERIGTKIPKDFLMTGKIEKINGIAELTVMFSDKFDQKFSRYILELKEAIFKNNEVIYNEEDLSALAEKILFELE